MPPRNSWRNQVALVKSRRPEPGLMCVVMATQVLIANSRGRPWRQSVRALLGAVAPTIATLKALSFKVRSTRRFWGSSTTIDIRLKW
jgi:hypothetical protein